jgi:hypothetical protein
MSALLQDAFAEEYSILSSAGSHASEDWCTIITRKTGDIARLARLARRRRAEIVHKFPRLSSLSFATRS